MSPDVFLSQHRLRTDGYGMAAGSVNADPATYVASLQLLSSLRTVDKQGNLAPTTYSTPGFAAGSLGPADFSPVMIVRLNTAMDQYRTALKTGDLPTIHAAFDGVNLLRMMLGYGPLPGLTDFELLAEGNSPAGELARFIYSERQSDGGAGTFVGSPIPWFDTVDAFNALAGYVPTVYQAPAPKPDTGLGGVFGKATA